MHLKSRDRLTETDIITGRHRQTQTEREGVVYAYGRHAQTYTYTLVIVPVQAMRSLSDYRRVIEW